MKFKKTKTKKTKKIYSKKKTNKQKKSQWSEIVEEENSKIKIRISSREDESKEKLRKKGK